MVKAKYVVVAAVVLAGSYFLYKHYFQSGDAAIRKQFDQLAEGCSKKDGEHIMAIAGRIQGIRKLFADPCTIEYQERNIAQNYSRDEIPQLGLRAVSFYSDLSVSFYDMKMSISGDTADVIATLKTGGKLMTGDPANDVQEINCVLQKIDGDWLFTRIRIVDVLQK